MYKNFSRTEREAFGSAADPLLGLIQEQLQNENYEPQSAQKILVPKSKFATRTYISISIPDWVVYTAITTLVLENAFQTERFLYKGYVFSNVPHVWASRRPQTVFRDWRRQYNRFNEASKADIASGYPFLAEVDMTSFFDLINHDLLLRKIQDYFVDPYSINLLDRLLESWVSGAGGYRYGHGIPQGPAAS